MDQEKCPCELVLKMGAIFALSILLLFGGAGTVLWGAGWLFLLIYAAFAGVAVSWLYKNNPTLLKLRLQFLLPFKRKENCLFFSLMIPLMCLHYFIPGLDSVRYMISSMPFGLQFFGFLMLILTFLGFFLVMRENPFLYRGIQIHKELGQTVISTGPYQWVRHPMYACAVLFYFAMALALGSYLALITALLLSITTIFFTQCEDEVLKNELEGYKEYCEKVKFRLLPGVW